LIGVGDKQAFEYGMHVCGGRILMVSHVALQWMMWLHKIVHKLSPVRAVTCEANGGVFPLTWNGEKAVTRSQIRDGSSRARLVWLVVRLTKLNAALDRYVSDTTHPDPRVHRAGICLPADAKGPRLCRPA
jgi:hypothetical protein